MAKSSISCLWHEEAFIEKLQISVRKLNVSLKTKSYKKLAPKSI